MATSILSEITEFSVLIPALIVRDAAISDEEEVGKRRC